MGIVDFVKNGARELAIARPDEAKGDIIWRHPDRTIPMKAQLTVYADEVALFFKDGKLVGQLEPGRHTLESANIPFLDQLVDKITGGNIFLTEIYFVNTREMSDVKFGGPVGKVRDPQSGLPAQLMVHGTFSALVVDPARLLMRLTGLGKNKGNSFLQWFRELVLKVLKDDIAELIVKKQWPLLNVTSSAYTEEIEEETIAGLRAHVDGYGLQVVRLGNFEIAMSEEDEKRLDTFYERASYVNMAGGMAGYQQFAQAEMVMKAGDGMARGGGGGGDSIGLQGAGLGMGFGMAAQMMGAMQQAHPKQPGVPPPQLQTPPSTMGNVTCPSCNQSVMPGKFCAQCGKPLPAASPRFCVSCGKPLSGKFCAECGTAAPA